MLFQQTYSTNKSIPIPGSQTRHKNFIFMALKALFSMSRRNFTSLQSLNIVLVVFVQSITHSINKTHWQTNGIKKRVQKRGLNTIFSSRKMLPDSIIGNCPEKIDLLSHWQNGAIQSNETNWKFQIFITYNSV